MILKYETDENLNCGIEWQEMLCYVDSLCKKKNIDFYNYEIVQKENINNILIRYHCVIVNQNDEVVAIFKVDEWQEKPGKWNIEINVN